MKNINWKVRIGNKAFWLAIVPAVLLAIQAVASIFGYQLDFGGVGNALIETINTVFAVLVILGVVNDPTTKGIKDSKQALTYKSPRVDDDYANDTAPTVVANNKTYAKDDTDTEEV